MATFLTCPCGHQWEAPRDGTAGPVTCPRCGAPLVAASGTLPPEVTGDSVTMPAPPPPVPPAPPVRDLPDIPGYEVLGVLGQGGMGLVYRARHIRLGRLVALKVILAGADAGPAQRARFQVEAEALASLQHPNVVQIYEVGEHGRHPYLSLELVEGGSLAQKLDRTPQAPREAARLVETLARAVHAAHGRGIVHRDLKPANVLLGADGTPKITDFGLAKHLDHDADRTAAAFQTQTGAVLGTPTYMAPEQAAGEARLVGPAADTYALGVILYEMLTGRPPFQGSSTLDTLEQVRSREPVPPGRVQPKVPRDLEVICLKCLEKDPARRYASAEALAEDLRRFLDHEPIRARPAGLPRRLAKWVRRHPTLTTLLAAGAVAGLALVAVLAWSNVRLREAAERAENRSRWARRAVDEMYRDVAAEWLEDEPHRDPLRSAFLRKALEFYQEIAREEGDDPEVRRGTALAWFHAGQIRRALMQESEAEEAYGQAISLLQELSANFPGEPRYRQDLADSYNWRGELFRESGGSFARAEQDYRRALQLQEQLTAQDPAEPAYWKDRARSLYNLGIVGLKTGRLDQAGRDLGSAIEILGRLHAGDPASTNYRHELARCRINRGILRKEQGRPAQAGQDLRRAVALLQSLLEEGRPRAVYRFELAVCYLDLGNLLRAERKRPEALRELTRAAELLDRLATDFPTRTAYRKKRANTHISLGSVLYDDGKLAEAEGHWQQARSALQKLAEEAPGVADYQKLLGIVLGNLALVCFQRKDLEGARGRLVEAVGHLRLALGRNANDLEARQSLRDQYQSLAEVRLRRGDHAGAVAAAREMATVLPGRAQDAYYAACFVARAVPVAEQDGRQPDLAARQARARAYARQALDLLRETVARRPRGVWRLCDEQAVFAPLRGGPELEALLARVDGQTVPTLP
jgi:serine/threonine-protein kinase